MSFVIAGLDPEKFTSLSALPDAALAARGVIAKTADLKPGYPCRVTLEDADPGERVFLLNYESHRAATPYRSVYAIYVRAKAGRAARFENALPPVFQNRPIALRLFDEASMLVGADMGQNGALERKIEAAFARADVAYIHAHNAMHGCFAAEIRRA